MLVIPVKLSGNAHDIHPIVLPLLLSLVFCIFSVRSRGIFPNHEGKDVRLLSERLSSYNRGNCPKPGGSELNACSLRSRV